MCEGLTYPILTRSLWVGNRTMKEKTKMSREDQDGRISLRYIYTYICIYTLIHMHMYF